MQYKYVNQGTGEVVETTHRVSGKNWIPAEQDAEMNRDLEQDLEQDQKPPKASRRKK